MEPGRNKLDEILYVSFIRGAIRICKHEGLLFLLKRINHRIYQKKLLAIWFAYCGYRTIFLYLQRNMERYVYLRSFRMKFERKPYVF